MAFGLEEHLKLFDVRTLLSGLSDSDAADQLVDISTKSAVNFGCLNHRAFLARMTECCQPCSQTKSRV